jgi:thiol:disulfide interchange protein DsbC
MKTYVVLASIGLLGAAAGLAVPASQQPAAASPVPAASPIPAPAPLPVSAETLRAVATAAGGGVKPEDVRATPIPGMFELREGPRIIYMSQDGHYVIAGDLYRIADHFNLTDARLSEVRKKLIDAMPESKMVVFSPAKPKYTVTVFTDVDCPYCQALHKQIDEYNKLGIRVRYVFYPRTGPDTESWYKAEQVWCSADRKAALTDAKLGKPLSAKVCKDTPVAQEYELGKAVGLEGTPAIVASNGAMVGGYLPPDKLVEELEQLKP